MGCLFIVPTPIGNLEDITLRAMRVLGEVSLVLAEDTRQTRRLLEHLDIKVRLLSYHQHNKRTRIGAGLRALAAGDVALVSNAGMPGIADPGYELIRAAVDTGIEVDVLPGPSAATTAVVGAALPAPGFLFMGFLPRTRTDLRQRLEAVSQLEYSLVMYEAPHRLLATLRIALEILGDRPAVAARELSKLHQEYVRGSLAALLDHFELHEPRGELTLVVAGASGEAEDRTAQSTALLRALREQGADSKTAIEVVVRRCGIARNDAYRLWLSTAQEQP